MGQKQITNPGGAFGYTDNDQKFADDAVPFIASGAVTAKTLVQINTDGTVTIAPTNGTASLCIGVARDAAATGSAVTVQRSGYVKGVTAQGAIAAGDVLKRSATTAGAVATTASPATGEAFAVAVAASSGGLVDIFIK